MTLPRKPESVKKTERELEEAKRRRKELERPAQVNGFTVETVPTGRYVWKETEQVSPWKKARLIEEEGTRSFATPSGVEMGDLRPGQLPRNLSPRFELEWRGDELYVREKFRAGEWVWDDPHKETRAELHRRENERLKALSETDEILGRPHKPWQRRPGAKKRGARPGSRKLGVTILTGGLGAYGKPDTRKSRLG